MELGGTARLSGGPAEDVPFVSVLVPVRNEAGFIGPCLRALAAQDYPRDRFEVIVLDGMSNDGTELEVRRAAVEPGLRIVIEANRRRTTATALNRGLQLALGDIIIRVDGHTRVAPDFVRRNVAALQEHGADAAGGSIDTRARTTTGRAIALAMSSPFGVGDAAFRTQGGGEGARPRWTDSVPFAAYRRDVFDRIGVFAEDIDRGEDDEFNYRLRERGGRILHSPDVRSEYYSRESFGALWRQYWGYGLAKAAVLGRHPRRLRPRHLVPSAFVLALLLGGLGGILDRRLGRIGLLAAGAYLIANIRASFGAASRGGWRLLPLLPPAFATIHLAAGTGMLAGYLRLLLARRRRPPE